MAADRTSLLRRRTPRKRHAASASRILAAGLSVAATFGMTAHWGAAAAQADAEASGPESVGIDVAPATTGPPEPAQRVVIVRRIIREVYADPVPGAATDTSGAITSAPAPAPAPAPVQAPAPAATPSLPSAALAPPPVAAAPAPATSSNGS